MNRAVLRVRLLILALLALAALRAAETPAALPPNAPWKIHQTTKAIYPPRLMQNAVTHGEARVRVSIDATGQLLDALVTAYSHREFGEEALRVVKTWRFEPGRENGQPIGEVGDISFAFEVNGTFAVINNSAMKDGQARSSEPLAYGAESTKNLDRIPTSIGRLAEPVYPQDWSNRGITGSATVEFYIDETGRARIPFVIEADHPLLGGAGVAAVAQWRFEPPTRGGKPVLVRAQQVFTFYPPKK